ncbi:hypothetical protein ACWCQL_39140 [Streptomyces sp. NPDC002073]|uniref:hypothetical protein n=1 Tax=Streptomyces sp. NBC_00239 TaxID=2903640 RepID=UPI002E28CFEA|nr:hypothetical protein [Streptomyces sp. NBC_00239]
MDNDQSEAAGESLTDDELDQLRALLRRFTTYDLDQFELVKTQSPYAEAYIVISNKPITGTQPKDYKPI